MKYKENLIEAYAKLDKAVEIYLAKGGDVDDRPQLKVELEWRLRQLEAPLKEATVGSVKIWSDGGWYAEGYHTVIDKKDYPNIVPITENEPIEEYYSRLHIWIRNAFLRDSDLAITHICGQKRNLIHHINEDKQDNNVANLIVIPGGLHHIFHPTNIMMKADPIAYEFVAKFGDKALTTTTNTNIPQVFTFETTNVRVIIKNSEPWWVLSDVCKVLGLLNPTVVADRLPEKGRAKLNLGRQGEATIINEEGLYRVIFTSRKPEAERFQDWVFSEVLPQIRKTGSYGQPTITRERGEVALQGMRGEFSNVMSIIETAVSEKNTKIKTLETQLETWQNLVGDGGYISKRIVKNLKKEIQNV